MPKQIKSVRKNFRFTEQIASTLENNAADLDLSENELASISIFDFLQDKSKFVSCPACGKKAYVKQMIPSDGIFTIHHICGAKIWYDPDAGKIVKFKKS